MTGYAENAIKENGQIPGDAPVLTKPFSLDALGDIVTRLLLKPNV